MPSFASPNYHAIVLAVGKDNVFLLVPMQVEIFVVKVGPTCENEADLDEKRIFH